jgi:hypothetical protein
MKKLRRTVTRRLSPVLLYREDIEQIFTILRELSPDLEVATDDCAFDNADEWLEVKRDYLPRLEIKTRPRLVTVDLHPHWVQINAIEDTIQCMGALTKIEQLLRSRGRAAKTLAVVDKALIPFTVLFTLATAHAVLTKSWFTAFFLSLAAVVWITLWVWGVYLHNGHAVTIIPKYRVDAPSFWRRNSDKIWIAAIGAAIGSVLGILGTMVKVNMGDRTTAPVRTTNEVSRPGTNAPPKSSP